LRREECKQNTTCDTIQDEDEDRFFPQNRYFRLVVDVSMRNSTWSERKDEIKTRIACSLDRHHLEYNLLKADNKDNSAKDVLRKIDLRLSPSRKLERTRRSVG
jgi:hypothetical protein